MNLNELEQHVLAYFLANHALDINVAGRFSPRGELELSLTDRIGISTRKFGRRAVACSARVANEFIQLLIDEQALSTTRDNFGGVLHQFQTNTYRDLIKNLQASNPLVGRAQAAGPGFWDEAFATLTGEGEP